MTFEIKLSGEDLNKVLSGLGELPAKVSFELILNLQKQVEEQMKSKETLPTEVKEESISEEVK